MIYLKTHQYYTGTIVEKKGFVYRIKSIAIRTMLFLILYFVPLTYIMAQNTISELEKAKVLIGREKFSAAYSILQRIPDNQVEEIGDSYSASFNYLKGLCLYRIRKHEDAIPFIQKGIQIMEKSHHDCCDYLEMLYIAGSCYKEIGDFFKAEEYLRRVILKGNYLDLNCDIKEQTYEEIAELYSLMGKTNLADICTSRIGSEMSMEESRNLETQLDELFEIYIAHDNLGKVDDCINDLKAILHLIEENRGKNNKDYLSYSFFLGAQLRYKCQRPKEAASVHKEMIEIGKHFNSYFETVCSAYEDYIRYLSENNLVDSIEQILPSAINYYYATKDREQECNYFEIIGNGLCDANNYEDGIRFLEKKWEGKNANSIKALDYLGAYYFYQKNDPQKALGYYNNAEIQIEGGVETNINTKILILERLVCISQRLGNTQEAVRYSKMLEPLIVLQKDDDDYSRFIIDWCVECVNSGENEKAKELALVAETQLDKVSSESIVELNGLLGYVYIKIGEYKKSIEKTIKGIELVTKEKGNNCMELITLYHNLGRAYMLDGDKARALSFLYKSKNLQIELEGQVVMPRTLEYIKECEAK